MIYPLVPFPVTLSDPQSRFQRHGDALDVLYAQLMRDLCVIAKFLCTIHRTTELRTLITDLCELWC